MPKIMRSTALFSFAAAVFASILFLCLRQGVFLTLAITFGTIFYHFGMRLLVGAFYDRRMKNRADYTKKRYQLHPWEQKLYRLLRVKQWKHWLPTYEPDVFSREYHTWDEIAQAMCQSELVHKTNMVLSFVPLLFSLWFGSFFVFLATSVCGALLDLLFVIVQRYNRPRIVKIAQKRQ